MKIGIIGGSFNPVHNAHLVIAEEFMRQMSLETIFFVIAFRSPFKTEINSEEIASPEHRLAMLELALRTKSKFSVEKFEILRPQTSFTIDTVRYFREKFPDSELFLLIGSDQALEFTSWKDWQDILRIAQLCIAHRPVITAEQESRISMELTVENHPPKWISAPLLEISSTEIRKKIKSGESITEFVPSAVSEFIQTRNLFAK